MADLILVVDDSLTVRKDLEEAFQAAGFATAGCASLAEARAFFKDQTPLLMILDVLLPDGDGLDLLAELRRMPSAVDLPVLILSTEAEIRDRIRGLTQGADEFVGKPYETSYVVGRATELLRRREVGTQTPLVVLVIDDSLTFREELGALLRKEGYQVVLATSGEEGLHRAVDIRPGAIIVDGVMPGLDGPTVVRRIRLDPGLCSTPCMLLTASEGAAGEVLALDAGADAYVRKTESMEIVLARLKALLRGAAESRGRSLAGSLLGPKRILTVDDSLTYLEQLADQIRDDGYEVIKAQSGEEALALLEVEKVDCILLDLLMPGLSGTETCRRIKGSSVLRNVPLIMLTALEDTEAMIEGINAGADDYVAKSAEFEVLKARLRAQLRRKQFEDDNRLVREEILRKDAEARAAREIAETRRELLDEISRKNEELSLHMQELQRLNKEMQMFAYSVSHDLRQPLRGMDSFSKLLLEHYASAMDDKGKHYLERIRAGAQRMNELIEGLLTLSRVSQKPLAPRPVRLDLMAGKILSRLRDVDPERRVEVQIHPDLKADGDSTLVESVLENLLGNAWKFTSQRELATIELGVQREGGRSVYYIRDNGAGFDMRYAERMFSPFQRLHSTNDFEGTGIGLATVQRIIHRHGGRIWAEGVPGQGATFFFTLQDLGELHELG